MIPVLSALLGFTLRGALLRVERDSRRRLILFFRQHAAAKMRESYGSKLFALNRAATEIEDISVHYALDVARQLSSGTFSTAQLRRMGHPYRHGGRPPQNAAIINRQSGSFYRGWQIKPVETRGGRITAGLINTSPHAVLLMRGTSRMIARPILQLIEKRVTPRRRALYRAAIRKAMTRS